MSNPSTMVNLYISNLILDLIYKSVNDDGFICWICQRWWIRIVNPYTMTDLVYESVNYDGFIFCIRIRIRYTIRHRWRIYILNTISNPLTMTDSYLEFVYNNGFNIQIRQLWLIRILNLYTDSIYKSVIVDGFIYWFWYRIR